MGNTLAGFFNRLWNLTSDVRVTMVGLDAAGKTTVLYKFKLNETVSTIPTIGFNVETVQYKNVNFTVWDVGGQARIRPLWKHYFQGADAVIYVVDSADKGRLEEARDELQAMMEEVELSDAALLVLANKQDMPFAMKPADLLEGLGLRQMKQQRPWYIQGCVATKGEGLYEGMDWLATQLSHKKRHGVWKY